MKLGSLLLLTIVFDICFSARAAAQTAVSIDVGAAISDTSRRQIGVNTNYLIDDDANRAGALRALADALREAGVRYLRYPGGEKADAVLWSVWPYAASVPTLARWAPQDGANVEWPSSDPSLVQPDGRTFAIDPLTFDEFMAVCRAIDCVPTLVVCYDSMYKPPQAGGVAPDRALLLETAREWVRYANVTMGYNVRYWEIGNESYLNGYNGSATAADYARDLLDFSQAMKAVDPSIQIGANGHDDDWWRVVLPTASGAIDFLAVHHYPAWAWGSYSYYQNNSVDLLGDVRVAEQALDAYAPGADRARIRIAATEINSADWTGLWPHDNTLGHAIVLFDMMGELLQDSRVEFSQIWNTRWIGGDSAPTPRVFDLVDRDNQLQATGRASAIWGQFLRERLVATTSTQDVKTYASYSPATGKLSVFLINKAGDPRAVTLSLTNFARTFTADKWTFSGDGPDDTSPRWTYEAREQTPAAITLPPVSITVLDIAPGGRAGVVPGIIEAEDFDEGGFWDTSPENSGLQYRDTAVDIESCVEGGFNVGWMDAGEWLDYTIEVEMPGVYDVQLRVATPYDGRAVGVSIDGEEVAASLAVPNTGAWQSWETIDAAAVYLTPGVHRVRIHAVTDLFNVNWILLQRSQESDQPLPLER